MYQVRVAWTFSFAVRTYLDKEEHRVGLLKCRVASGMWRTTIDGHLRIKAFWLRVLITITGDHSK